MANVRLLKGYTQKSDLLCKCSAIPPQMRYPVAVLPSTPTVIELMGARLQRQWTNLTRDYRESKIEQVNGTLSAGGEADIGKHGSVGRSQPDKYGCISLRCYYHGEDLGYSLPELDR